MKIIIYIFNTLEHPFINESLQSFNVLQTSIILSFPVPLAKFIINNSNR